VKQNSFYIIIPSILILAASVLVTGICSVATAQVSPRYYGYPQHHLPWYTIESEHFNIHFQEGNSRSAQVVSRIAEEVYPDITKLYEYEPNDKIDIVLNDREDYSNGAAYFFDNQMTIWIPALDTPLRGTHDWFRNVITHEFTHIVQLQASMKRSRRFPAFYLQWLSYEDVRRPDVLYGFPNGIISYPFSAISVPAWFAEGTAQYQRSEWAFDTWDSHRDMVLRSAILSGEYLSLRDMGTFASKNALEREMVYNQGYAFTIYLAHRFGEVILRDISKELGKSGIHDVDRALKRVTGLSGVSLFNAFIQEKKAYYTQAVEPINPTKSTIIESSGFFNFAPKLSPDRSTFAYLSNKRRLESGLELIIKNRDSLKQTMAVLDLGRITGNSSDDRISTRNRLIKRIRSSYTFTPDSRSIIYTRNRLNQRGEAYNDLFIYNLTTGEIRQLTYNGRFSDPATHPDGTKVVAVREERGTKNIYLVDIATGTGKKMTDYNDGEQVFSPTWHPDGDKIYYSYYDTGNRSIRALNMETGTVTPVFNDTHIDYRDPYIDPEGLFLYYSADLHGIFNIYRIPIGGGTPEQVTSVTGGAFMPFQAGDSLYYSEYSNNSYKIAVLDEQAFLRDRSTGQYRPSVIDGFSSMADKPDHERKYTAARDDSDIDPLEPRVLAQADTGTVQLKIPTSGSPDTRQLRRYNETFTGFNIFPVIRFDNYSRLNGSNRSLFTNGKFGQLGENLLRDMKMGINFSSREVIDRLSIYGGALFGFGSKDAEGLNDFFRPARLTDLDRDLFLITELRGLPFIKKRWSPTVSLELYNLRRNVNDGLQIEEFPCTACLPDTLSTDIAYNIWEVDLFLRSKINDYSLLELGAGYSPYRVETGGFFSREIQQFVPSSSSEYFRGATFSLRYIYEHFHSYSHGDVAPIGWELDARYAYEPGELLDRFEVDEGSLSPVYITTQNHSFELSTRYGFPIRPRHTGELASRFFTYLNEPDDFFYLDYIGGFPGMRSYPFFAVGGNTTFFSRFSYIFPLINDINRQVGRHTLDKLYLRMFTETGNGWGGPLQIGSGLKTGIGVELRFAFNTYYLYPMKLFISGAYGFNQFDVTLPNEFITESSTGNVSYGHELLIHFGLSFDFNILNHASR